MKIVHSELRRKTDNGVEDIWRCMQCHQEITKRVRGAPGVTGNQANALSVAHWKQEHPENYRRLLGKWKRQLMQETQR